MRVVFCSCPPSNAKEIAKQIIEKQLAACVQIVPQIESVYRWEGKVCEDNEALLLIKTHQKAVDKLTSLLLELHPYDVPEVVSVKMEPEEGNQMYLKWLLGEIPLATQSS